MNNSMKSLFLFLASPFLLKGEDKYAYGIPFFLHKLICKRNMKKLLKYKDTHLGEKCFIVGTGPSLTLEDVNMLKGQVSFGVNTLFKYYTKTDWRANYYCIIDPKTYGNLKEQIENSGIENLFYPINRIQKIKNGIPFELNCSDFFKQNLPSIFDFTKFTCDAGKEVYDGASVVYVAMQLAAYMGFQKIYLLGVDCNYGTGSTTHCKDLNYSKDYKYKWGTNTALTMLEGFKIAKKYADGHGIEIYNATRGGMLDVFERVSLEEAIVKN